MALEDIIKTTVEELNATEETRPDYSSLGFNSYLSRQLGAENTPANPNTAFVDGALTLSSLTTVIGKAESGQIFKVSPDGLQLGARDFSSAPFRVTLAGALTATSATISGTITATAGTIGGWSINATSIYTGTEDHSGYTANAGDLTIYSDGSDASIHAKNFYIDTAGNLYCTSATVSGAVTTTAGSSLDGQYLTAASVASAAANLALRGWTQTCVFSITDADTVAWAAGVFTASDGTAYNIGAGNAGNMSARTYVYLDIAVSTTAYQVTTTASTAVGNGKCLVAVAENGAEVAEFQVFGGAGGIKLSVDDLAANSASVNQFVANTANIADAIITNAKVVDLAVSKLTAGAITSKSVELAVADGTGDVEIRSGIAAGDFANAGAANGFILGIDDSDSNLAKFYFGNALDYLKYDGVNVSASGLINIDLPFTAGEALTAFDAVGLYGQITLADETADADVYVDMENPDTVYNTDDLWIGTRGAPNAGDERDRAIISWTGLGDLIPAGATVISVKFTVQVANANASASSILIYVNTGGPPNESSTTWNGKPSIEGTQIGTFDGQTNGVQTATCTITTTQWGRIRDYGISLLENWASGAILVSVKDRAQANPPKIEITYKVQDGSVYKVNATTAEYANSFMGIALATTAKGSTVKVRTEGKVSGMTGLTAYSTYYLSDTDGAIATSAGSESKIIGRALSTTELQVKYTI